MTPALPHPDFSASESIRAITSNPNTALNVLVAGVPLAILAGAAPGWFSMIPTFLMLGGVLIAIGAVKLIKAREIAQVRRVAEGPNVVRVMASPDTLWLKTGPPIGFAMGRIGSVWVTFLLPDRLLSWTIANMTGRYVVLPQLMENIIRDGSMAIDVWFEHEDDRERFIAFMHAPENKS